MTDRTKKNIVELTRISCEKYHEIRKMQLIVVADNVRSMHNIGSMLRTADAFLVKELILGGISGCPPHPEISKTALGAEESVSWRHVDDTLAEVRRLKEEGWEICVLEQTHNSVPLQDFAPRGEGRYVLVVGNEVDGVSQEIVNLADTVLEIPQCGTKHSLNVSVSAGLAMWHFFSHLELNNSTISNPKYKRNEI